jgi:hypothetical protein
MILTEGALERIVLTLGAVCVARGSANRKPLRSLQEREGEPIVQGDETSARSRGRIEGRERLDRASIAVAAAQSLRSNVKADSLAMGWHVPHDELAVVARPLCLQWWRERPVERPDLAAAPL